MVPAEAKLITAVSINVVENLIVTADKETFSCVGRNKAPRSVLDRALKSSFLR